MGGYYFLFIFGLFVILSTKIMLTFHNRHLTAIIIRQNTCYCMPQPIMINGKKSLILANMDAQYILDIVHP